MKKISIFMNVFNVHVNRLPVSGKVVWLKYVPGAFFNASLDKSSKDNERMISKIEIRKNKFIYVVQIAGLIARRIKCDLEENQNVIIGERFGIIRFGSRLDVYLPKDFSVDVLEGQTTIAGETIISHMDSNNKNIKNK
jgi:phosphatidylserine decarboxylase